MPAPDHREAAKLVADLCQRAALLDPDRIGAMSTVLKDPVFANPRLIKRCINRFAEVWGKAERSSAQDSPHEAVERDQALVKWIAATERWPQLRRILLTYDGDTWRQLGRAVADASQAPPGPEAAEILAQRGARGWLAGNVFSSSGAGVDRFRAADQRLRERGL